MRHRERVYDTFPQIFNDAVQPSNILKGNGYIVGVDQLHRDCLLVCVQRDVLPPIPLFMSASPAMTSFIFRVIRVGAIVVFSIIRSVMVGEDGLESATGGERLLLRFCFRTGFRVEARDELARKVIGENRLSIGQYA